MYLNRFTVKNIRCIKEATMEFAEGEEAGWHVILGANGTGKSSMVRAFALLMMGEKEAWASRQDFGSWMKNGENSSLIDAQISNDSTYDHRLYLNLSKKGDPYIPSLTQYDLHVEIKGNEDGNSTHPTMSFTCNPYDHLWAGKWGWFSASFGPFRRFTGGDNRYDRLFATNKRLAPHLTALGEDVALTDAMSWLTTLFSQSLQDEKNRQASKAKQICNAVVNFLNDSAFLPHQARIKEVTNKAVLVEDGNGVTIPLDQLSDGYRSALSLVIELIRQMFELYDPQVMIDAITAIPGTIQAPGVVFIDEVDAHLHPSWQRDIGRWLTRCFPKVQFVVTTHSPIVCRAIVRDDGSIGGSVWRLPAPGEDDVFRQIDDADLQQLLYGNVLDAYATELFGSKVLRSEAGEAKLERLAELNVKALQSTLSAEEEAERRRLRQIFPANAGTLE